MILLVSLLYLQSNIFKDKTNSIKLMHQIKNLLKFINMNALCCKGKGEGGNKEEKEKKQVHH